MTRIRPFPKSAQNSGRTAGRSRNPGGRPKKDIASEIAQRVFEENADAIYKAMLKALLKGDPEVFAVLADRAYGKLTQKVEIPGIENLPEALAEARARKNALESKRDGS